MATNPRTPGGRALEKGYQCAILLANIPTVELFERTVQPPGLEGGEKVDISTQHNVTVKTYAPQDLKEVTDSQMVCGYDPACLATLLAQINVPQKITLYFPNGDTWLFDGYLKNFAPNAMSPTAMPEATCTIVATNVDSDSTTGAEIDPSWVASA